MWNVAIFVAPKIDWGCNTSEISPAASNTKRALYTIPILQYNLLSADVMIERRSPVPQFHRQLTKAAPSVVLLFHSAARWCERRFCPLHCSVEDIPPQRSLLPRYWKAVNSGVSQSITTDDYYSPFRRSPVTRKMAARFA